MSRRRLLHTVHVDSASRVRIYRDTEWDCYVVKVSVYSGAKGDTHTESEETSLQAARSTAAAQIRSLRRMSADSRRVNATKGQE